MNNYFESIRSARQAERETVLKDKLILLKDFDFILDNTLFIAEAKKDLEQSKD